MDQVELPEEVCLSLENVLEYNWRYERLDYIVQLSEDGDVSSHVFASLVTLRNFLDGTDRDVRDFLEAG